MSSRLILAAVAALALASPALAQTAAPAPAAPAAQAAAPTEEDVEAAAEAFKADLQKLAEEIDAVVTAAGDDKAKASAEADILVARHQPVADAFADTLDRFLQSMAAVMPAEQMAAMPDVLAKIRSGPAEVKAHRLAPPAAAQ